MRLIMPALTFNKQGSEKWKYKKALIFVLIPQMKSQVSMKKDQGLMD